jgi:hypothetical protein
MTLRQFSTLVLVLAAALGIATKASALPSYARQTGLACNGCHTTPPELNQAGRLFKLLGFTDRKKDSTIPTAQGDKRRPELQMLENLPLGVWFETSNTSTNKAQPSSQGDSFEFPQDISLFLAGAWADHLGSFLQVTYDAQANQFGMDNTDIRYARKIQKDGKDWIFGITLNNNPTLEDVWNATPAWGYPFIASDSAPTPAAAAILQGGLAQDVAGAGGYTMWDNHLYLAGAIYRSDHIGNPQPNTGTSSSINIQNVAPYWRVAWQQAAPKAVFEIGAYGMHLNSTPNAVSGTSDTYTDVGPDVEYDKTLGRDVISFRATYLHEATALNATYAASGASLVNHHLNTGNANVEYHFGNRLSAAMGWFLTSGTADGTLYAPASVTGSANGSPRSTGYIGNFSWWPMQNIDLAVQYTGYTRFNGGNTNYDGSGRNASDNNTTYLLARFVF